MYQSANNPRAVRARQAIEIRILKQVVKDALAAGYTLQVYDSEELHEPTADEALLLTQLYETDEDVIYLLKGGETVGWVKFVYGNDGWDVISDYTVNLEDLLRPANRLSESLAG